MVSVGLMGACGGEEADVPATDMATGTDTVADTGAGTDTATVADAGTGMGTDAGMDTVADATAAPGPSNKSCALAKKIGDFEAVNSSYGDWFTGKVKDRIDALAVLQPKDKDANCQLWQRVNPHCEPKCDLTIYQCTHDDGCQKYPVSQDVGKVVVTGLVKAVEIAAKGGAKKYDFSDFDDRAWKDGAAIHVKAPGGSLGALSLRGIGVPPLVVPNISWKMSAGKDLALSWTAAKGDWRVRISLNVDQHGLSPATLVCEVDDSGTFAVPAKLVDALLANGVSGAATALIERRTVDSGQVKGGCVELVVRSTVEAELTAQ